MKPHYEDLPTTSTPKQLQDQAAAQRALDEYFSTHQTPRIDHHFIIGHPPTVVAPHKPNYPEAIGYGLCTLVAAFIAYYAWKIERKLRARALVQLPELPSARALQPDEIRAMPTKAPSPQSGWIGGVPLPSPVSLTSVSLASVVNDPVPPTELPPLPGPIPRP